LITEHPVYPIPSRESFEADPDGVARFLEAREERIRLEKEDPYRYGFRPEIWTETDQQYESGAKDILILGGNRASKTEYAAARTLYHLNRKPDCRVWCFQTNHDNSIQMQQPAVFKYIPRELKEIKKSRVTNISYSQKNGFSDGTFVLPNGSQCFFRHYSQDINTIEGGEVDFVWCDELVPQDWLETIRYRLVTRGGELLVTFTPIEGYTPTVKGYLQGARTIKTAPAPILGSNETVPRIQTCKRKHSRIVYFHTSDNPFGGYENLKKTLEGSNRSDILCRAYGIPTRAAVQRFPKFDEKIHIIPADKVPRKGTRYHIVDPCSGRNWFMAWCIVDELERITFYREWPSPGSYIPGVGDPGDWAEPHGRLHDGCKGTAQRSFGWGLQRYKDEIDRLELENKEEIQDRIIDSRYSQASTLSREYSTTLLEECSNIGLFFNPSPTDSIGEGIDLINNLLDWNHTEELTSLNQPKLYISEACPNLIFAMKEWTGEDGKEGATKDCIDVIRYAVTARIGYVEPVSEEKERKISRFY
jgi:hypothetical protein